MTYKISQTEGKKDAAQHRKPNTTHCITACRCDGDISDIWTLISLISESNQSSNNNVKTLGLYRNICETFKTTINNEVGTHTTSYYHNNNGLLSW